MLRSMTGYGRAEAVAENYDIQVDIQSVNHRYFELNQHLPRTYRYLEPMIKETVKEKVYRGKIDLFLHLHPLEKRETIYVNQPVVEGYLEALREAGRVCRIPDDLSLSAIAQLPDVFSVQEELKKPDEISHLVMPFVKQALAQFLESREREGAALSEDLLEKLKEMEGYLHTIEERMPCLEEEYRRRLYGKMQEILADTAIDETRILTEASIFADKIATDEETVRLFSHIKQFRALLQEGGAVGKKCDFMIQEMNREINTIGSKVFDLKITDTVVRLKSTLEKIREQIQNLE